jgi:uncharacterized membrane protein YphA (DoxX/SURF4 family)
MDTNLSRVAAWTSTHRDVALDVLRVYLGLGLFIRGALVIDNPRLLGNYMSGVDWFWPLLVSHYVAVAHLGGGLLLMFGLVTRIAAAMQVPALVGAVFIVHLREGLMAQSQSLELSVLVLFMLLVFTVFGAGRLSLDRYVFGVTADDTAKKPSDHEGSAPGPVAHA